MRHKKYLERGLDEQKEIHPYFPVQAKESECPSHIASAADSENVSINEKSK